MHGISMILSMESYSLWQAMCSLGLVYGGSFMPLVHPSFQVPAHRCLIRGHYENALPREFKGGRSDADDVCGPVLGTLEVVSLPRVVPKEVHSFVSGGVPWGQGGLAIGLDTSATRPGFERCGSVDGHYTYLLAFLHN